MLSRVQEINVFLITELYPVPKITLAWLPRCWPPSWEDEWIALNSSILLVNLGKRQTNSTILGESGWHSFRNFGYCRTGRWGSIRTASLWSISGYQLRVVHLGMIPNTSTFSLSIFSRTTGRKLNGIKA